VLSVELEERIMKRTLPITVAFALLFLLTTALQAANWTGWITDENCGAKGANADHKSCALKCAGKGGKLVFYNNDDKKIYKLDDQDSAKKNIGHEVVVSGEATGDAIKVSSIAASK
jgi:hypothetical protein